MDAINFPQATKNMIAPPGFTKEEVFDLPVNEGFYFIRRGKPVPCLTSCWQQELTDEQLEEIIKTRKVTVYLMIMGYGMPAVSVDLNNPCPENTAVGKYFHETGKLPAEYLESEDYLHYIKQFDHDNANKTGSEPEHDESGGDPGSDQPTDSAT